MALCRTRCSCSARLNELKYSTVIELDFAQDDEILDIIHLFLRQFYTPFGSVRLHIFSCWNLICLYRCSYNSFKTKLHQMSLITIVIVLIVAGVLLYLVNNYIPMDGTVKRILNVVVIIVLVIWLLKAFGLFDSVSALKV
jgi:hypothetical protein